MRIMKNILYIAFAALLVTAVSCSKRLDLYPQNDQTAEKVYSTYDGYIGVLAKIYGTLSLTGNTGPAGNPDIGGGLDEGSQVPFIRAFFNHEVLPTDEAVCAWNDQTIWNFHYMKWTSEDPFIKGMYARPIWNITLINEYLRESTAEKLASRNITGDQAADLKASRAEARFLRAFNYWVMLDLFGKSTFITEEDGIGKFTPKQITRPELFNYIESELKAIDGELKPAKTAIYGRVDQGAEWALLARLYLNAEVYTGTKKYAEAAQYADKVIGAGYTLSPDYRTLFMADNDKQKNETIFVATCDGLHTQSFGNTTFFIHAASGADAADYGAGGGWNGYRATKALGALFSDMTGNTDKRAMFTTSKYGTSPAQIEIPDISVFDNGLHVKKYVNIRTDGAAVSDPTKTYSDIDFPIFRLAEMYLIYAEATIRNSGSADAKTLQYINRIRTRAYGGSTSGNVSVSDINLKFVLDERGRELYWEGHRRTDLIRYGLFTTSGYLWPWKGGVASGTAVDSKYNLYPIPSTNRNANPNLEQNPGY